MYTNDQPQPERRRRTERYAPQGQVNAAPSPQQGWQQPQYPQQMPVQPQNGYQPNVPPRGVPQAAQQVPMQNYQGQPGAQWQQPQQPQQGYGRGYYPPQQPPQPQAWSRTQARYEGGAQQGYQPPQQYQTNGGNGGKPGIKWLAIALIAVAVVVAVVMGVNAVRRNQAHRQLSDYVTAFDSVFCQNVYVDGIHLGGMTQQQAINAVTTKAQQRNDAWSVKLVYQGQVLREINASQLGMRVDVYAQLQQAWEQGHTGDLNQRKAAMDALAETPYQAYSALPSGDTTVVDNMLSELRNMLYVAPQDAAIVEFDPQKTNPFTFRDEVLGRSLDTDALKQTIYQMVSTMESGTLELTPSVIQPQVTRAMLEKQVSLRATASTKISSTSTENRTNNIKRAFQMISGTIVQPGETFSFNGIVGERSVENGFYEAIEYAYNEQVMGIGGGVCQASTTVYQAAVEAGMQITKREQHSLEVNYSELGKDATVYWSKNRKIDLAFKNTSDGPIYIVAAVQSDPDKRSRQVAKVSIYGMEMVGYEYKLEAKTVEVLPPPEEPKYIKDKKQEYVTYTDQEKVVQKAEEGYLIESYRVKYVDGVEVERALLYTDRYEPKQKEIYVGVKERE